MAKETFDRNKPGLVITNNPLVESIDVVLTDDDGTLDSVILTMVGTAHPYWYLAIYATSLIGPGITSPSPSLYRLIASIQPSSPLSSYDITDAYKARFGNSEVGAAVFFRFTWIDSSNGEQIHLWQVKSIIQAL